jgi:hypothetical protein
MARRSRSEEVEPEDHAEVDPLDKHPEKRKGPPGPAHEVSFTEVELTDLANELSGEIEDELSTAHESREEDYVRYHKLYDSVPREATKTYPFDRASNVVVPFAAIYCDTVEARIMQSMFAVTPHWTATELSKKMAPATKPVERWFDWRRKNVWKQEQVVEDAVKETLKLGTSVIYQGWIDETRMRYVESRDEKGKIVGATIPGSKRFGPRPEWVSIGDTIMPTGYTDHQTSPYFAHRIWLSQDRLFQLAHANFIEDEDKVIGQPDEESELRKRRREAKGVELSKSERYGLYAIWNVWFSRDFDGDGYPEEYVMMLHSETKTILRLKPNPFPSQMRPYVVTRYISREGDFYGLGIPERIEQLQEEASTIHNQRRDRAHLANIVMYVSEAANKGIGNSIRPQSGKVIKVLGINSLKEFHPSTNVTIDVFEENSVTMLADRAIGISELSEGKVSSPIGRAAATTIMSMLQEGARRFDRVAAKMRAALGDQAHQIAELDQTFGLPAEGDFGSPEQILDEKDAKIVREILEAKDDLRTLLAIDLSVSTQAVNREVEKQSNMQLYGQVIQYAMQIMQLATGLVNPQMPPELRQAIVKLVKGVDLAMQRVFQSFSAFDLDDVLVAEVFANMKPQAPQQMLPGPQNGGTGEPPMAAGGEMAQ